MTLTVFQGVRVGQTLVCLDELAASLWSSPSNPAFFSLETGKTISVRTGHCGIFPLFLPVIVRLTPFAPPKKSLYSNLKII